MRRGVRARWSACPGTGVPEQLLEQPAEASAAADRAREQVDHRADVVVRVVEVAQRRLDTAPWCVLSDVAPLLRTVDGRCHAARQDRPEDGRRVVNLITAARKGQRCRRRVRAPRDVPVGNAPYRWGQQRLVYLQGAVALNGEVAANQPRTAKEGRSDLAVQAAGAEQGRLHGNADQHVAGPCVRIDEDGRAVGPRKLVRCSGGHLDRAPGDGGCEKPIAAQSGGNTLRGNVRCQCGACRRKDRQRLSALVFVRPSPHGAPLHPGSSTGHCATQHGVPG